MTMKRTIFSAAAFVFALLPLCSAASMTDETARTVVTEETDRLAGEERFDLGRSLKTNWDSARHSTKVNLNNLRPSGTLPDTRRPIGHNSNITNAQLIHSINAQAQRTHDLRMRQLQQMERNNQLIQQQRWHQQQQQQIQQQNLQIAAGFVGAAIGGAIRDARERQQQQYQPVYQPGYQPGYHQPVYQPVHQPGYHQPMPYGPPMGQQYPQPMRRIPYGR